MIIAVPKEIENNETRVSITPQSAAELIKAGYKVKIESNAGKKSFFFDKDYQDVNAEIIRITRRPLSLFVISTCSPKEERLLVLISRIERFSVERFRLFK